MFSPAQIEQTESVKCSKHQGYLEWNNALRAVFVSRLLTHVWLCPHYELITLDTHRTPTEWRKKPTKVNSKLCHLTLDLRWSSGLLFLSS